MKRSSWLVVSLFATVATGGWVGACGGHDPPAPTAYSLDKSALMDPASCRTCHADHYREWSGSMHAYAADDPLFVAMNARGQRETKGALGDFCVRCHAPMALRTGATTDGLNLASVPTAMKGVTCYFCHSVDAVEGTHNDPLHLANDGVLRAAIANPTANDAHAAAYSELHDRDKLGASSMCGSCHDVRNSNGVDLARTFAEWKGSLFAHDQPGQRLTCSACHMPGRDGVAAHYPGVPVRRVHDHSMPGVDVAISPFAETAAQRRAVQASLDPSLVARLCVTPKFQVQYTLDDAFAGHAWPSGAAYHRRAWVELTVTDKGKVVYQTGSVPDDKAVTSITDPDRWLLADQMLDAKGAPVEMLWSASTIRSAQLPPAFTNVTTDPRYYHAVTRTFDPLVPFDAVTARVHIRPVDYDFVDDLTASGDLDPSYRAKVTTFTLASTVLEWNRALGFTCVP